VRSRVLVANDRRIRLIYANKRKPDEMDAETLARLQRASGGSQERKETGGGGRSEEALYAIAQFVDERRSLRTTAQRSPLFWRPGGL
jgi:hypothetical protein